MARSVFNNKIAYAEFVFISPKYMLFDGTHNFLMSIFLLNIWLSSLKPRFILRWLKKQLDAIASLYSVRIKTANTYGVLISRLHLKSYVISMPCDRDDFNHLKCLDVSPFWDEIGIIDQWENVLNILKFF